MSENIKKQNQDKIEKIEDTTKYGEFIPSYFAWMDTTKQKDIVEKLEKITKGD